MNARLVCSLITLGGVFALQAPAHATFHLMQIEQLIGSAGGDTTAQAIQLRMRANGQRFVSEAQLVVVDAQGLNPVVLLDIDSDVANGALGSRVLIASATFPAQTVPAAIPDFFMTDIIPASYLAAGSLMFQEDVTGDILWRLSWGGAAYTGPNDGEITNDLDGNFGPPFGAPLPSCSAYVLRFTKAANVRSTNNAADYRLEQNGQFVNNAGGSFAVSAPLPSVKIQTIDASASEQPMSDTGRFRVTRTTTCTGAALSVLYAVSGTATNTADYQMLRGTLNVPIGATTANITVRPINDPTPEPDETVIVTLSPSAAYTIGVPNNGTVIIHSNE